MRGCNEELTDNPKSFNDKQGIIFIAYCIFVETSGCVINVGINTSLLNKSTFWLNDVFNDNINIKRINSNVKVDRV